MKKSNIAPVSTGLLAGKALCGLAAAAAAVAFAADCAWSDTRSLKEIRESGVVIQQWDTSCAAAALATVLTYAFNDPVPEREVASGLLRQTDPLRVRHRGGFSMLDMKRYAEERGYKAVGFTGMELDDIRFFHSPIVPIDFKGYPHYVVFLGLDGDGFVRIADPAFGNRKLRQERFEEIWTNGTVFAVTGRPS